MNLLSLQFANTFMSISYHSPIQEVMVELKEAGWTKSAEKPVDQILNKDIKEIFRLVDKDRSGEVSRTVRETVIIFFISNFYCCKTKHKTFYFLFSSRHNITHEGGQNGGQTSGKTLWHQGREWRVTKMVFLPPWICCLQVQGWMKKTDLDNDGKLSYKEFNRSLKIYLKITPTDTDDAE